MISWHQVSNTMAELLTSRRLGGGRRAPQCSPSLRPPATPNSSAMSWINLLMNVALMVSSSIPDSLNLLKLIFKINCYREAS